MKEVPFDPSVGQISALLEQVFSAPGATVSFLLKIVDEFPDVWSAFIFGYSNLAQSLSWLLITVDFRRKELTMGMREDDGVCDEEGSPQTAAIAHVRLLRGEDWKSKGPWPVRKSDSKSRTSRKTEEPSQRHKCPALDAVPSPETPFSCKAALWRPWPPCGTLRTFVARSWRI